MTVIRVLSASDVNQLTNTMSAESLVRMLGVAMYQLSTSRIEKPLDDRLSSIQSPIRIATESNNHKTLYMPSKIGSTTSIKIVSVPTATSSLEVKAAGLPASTLLLDGVTGAVKAILNASELTGLRTAAASALATVLLAKPGSRNLLVFGTGIQSYYNARLIIELFPSIVKVDFVGRKFDQRARDLVERLNLWLESQHRICQVKWISTPFNDALKDADIVCTCTPSTTPLFESIDLKSSVHINSIGSYTPTMFEFPPSLISPSSSSLPKIPTILVDSEVATLSEAGELISSKITADNIIELGEMIDESGAVLVGELFDIMKVRLRIGGMSLFKCVGVGVMDSVVAELVLRRAIENDIGVVVKY